MADIKPGTGSSAIVPRAPGKIRQLDTKREPDELITPDKLDDKPRVARWLTQILRDLETLKRRWAPRRIDFEDVEVDSSGGNEAPDPPPTLFRFHHGFGGRVRWWVTDWRRSSNGPLVTTGPALLQIQKTSLALDGTDNNTLVLRSYVAGTVTIRIEEAG